MKTTCHFSSVLPHKSAILLRGLSAAIAMFSAGVLQAQSISSLPSSITLYVGQTVTNAFSLTGWDGSNVTVTVGGAATPHLSMYTVNPATDTATARSLVTRGGSPCVAQTLNLIASESPAAVHTVTNTVSVTVRSLPTVAYLSTNGFHNGHIDQDSTTATLTVTRNPAATRLWGKHSNTTLFPSTDISPTPASGSTFNLVPLSGQAGSDIFTVFVTDDYYGWTNSITVSLTVVPVPTVIGWQTSLLFDEDTLGTNHFSVAYGGNTNLLSYSASFSPSDIIENYDFLPVGGISTNRALVLHPFANANGTATATFIVSDGTHTTTSTFTVTVKAIPDPPSITGLPSEIYLSNKDPWTNVFTSVTIGDPDDDRPSPERFDVFVDDPELQLVFSNSTVSAVSNLNARLATQNTWMRSLNLKAAEDLFGVAGTTNDISVIVIASGRSDNLVVTNTMLVHLYFKNTPPEFIVKTNPGQDVMEELDTRTPFTLDSITDPDDTQVSFTLSMFIAPGYEAYGTLSTSIGNALPPTGGVIGEGNCAYLDNLLCNIQFNAAAGVLTENQTLINFIFELNDGVDTTVHTNHISLIQLKRSPIINLGNGAPKNIYVTSAAPAASPYPLVYVTDPDEAGLQPVSAAISVTPDIGDIDMITRAGMTGLQLPTALSALLRAATFTPYAGALDNLAVGQSVSARLALTVTDETGLSVANNEVVIRIERVNSAPELRVPEEQPVLFSPGTVVRPFADVLLSSDDTNAVTFSFSIDNAAKGVFGNVDSSATGFSAQGTTGYTITTADIGHILNLVTNITFIPSTDYEFPADDPYGTIFTLAAKDYRLLTSTKMLAIQVQDPPRNWLVTKLINDGTPGTFQHALEHFANNDVITFALASYPATIRMSSSAPRIETRRTLTIKGPGADLLTISGDADGNGTPDRPIFAVGSPVTIEGITFTHCSNSVGGAFSVINTNGKLTLRNVVIQDSFATQFGGAIDVVGGQLSVEGCAFIRNSVTEDGYGGGAISTYTDCDIGITNSLFDSNAQHSLNGAGGAIFAEFPDGSLDDFAIIDIVHCTFVDNADASLNFTASSVYAASGTHVLLFNTVFADDPSTRTLNLDSGAEIWSQGGNICDDSTYVPNQQQGGTSVYLLDPDFDLISTDARLSPLDTSTSILPHRLPLVDSPAIGFASPSQSTLLDQRGLLRVPDTNGFGTVGATDPAAASWPVITEIQLSAETGDSDQFIEVFVPRDGQDVDLAGYTLFVNGVAVHEFGRGSLALTNSVYTTLVPAAGISASYLLAPGRGVVIAFPKGEVADFVGFSPLNPTPVIRASLVTNAAEFAQLLSAQGRGSVAIAKSATEAPIARHTFLTVFNDPDSVLGTNRLATSHNSIVSAPQSRGFAFIPHSSVSTAFFGGWRGRPSVTSSSILLQSPGATVDGTPFGLMNATPQAVSDALKLSEDDVGLFDVLANDLDADGNDRLVIVDVSATTSPDAGDVASTYSQLGASVTMTPLGTPLRGTAISYDPRTPAFQALPVGVEILDTFFYEIIDIGSSAVESIARGTSSNTWVTATHHRLNTGDSVILSGSSVAAYNGEHVITVLDEHTFTIPVPFVSVPVIPGAWETANPRAPSARSEASVTVKVIGLNDAPVVTCDVVTNVTEVSTVRIMTRPELAGMDLLFTSDLTSSPNSNQAHLLDNDVDIDTDETWETLRVVGVFGSVHQILDYAGTVGASPVTVYSPAHGLVSGDEILVANYGGHSSYNGYHTVTVLDANSFSVPLFFVDNHASKGLWVVLNDDNRYHAVTDVGATVDLTLRNDPVEDHIVFDASTSTFLKGLAENELYTNRFYQAVEDSHGAIGIGLVDVEVVGINDVPTAYSDPAGIGVLEPLLNTSNTLEQVLSAELDFLYTLPPASGIQGRTDVQALDRSGQLPGTLVLRDFWSTDESTPIVINTADLLANDADIDRIDVLSITAVDTNSREGALLTLGGGQISYDPTVSNALQRLSREEMLVDTFRVAVSDGMTGGTVTSLVSVLVIGLNNTPVAQPDDITLSEDDVFTFNPILYPEETNSLHDFDLDINGLWPDDRLTMIVSSNLLTDGEARVDIGHMLARYNATVSERLNQLADWQSYTDSFEYTITDNSFLFAVSDEFYVTSNSVEQVLDVLANDRDYTQMPSPLIIVDVGPTLNGGTVTISADGSHLVYSSSAGFVGDDYFRYVVQNECGDRRSARVLVRSVVPSRNGVLSVANDHYTAAYGETAMLDVLANDNMIPAISRELVLSTNILSSSIQGQPILAGNAFIYTATNGLGPLAFTYEVSAGGVSTARADVVVNVVDRRGTLKTQNDTCSVLAGSSENELNILHNDNLVTGSVAHLRIQELLAPAISGTALLNPESTALIYTPNPGFVGVEHLRYLATDGVGGTGTGELSIVVGKAEAVIDFFAVLAQTNLPSVALDVLANDGVQPFPAGALVLSSVNPTDTMIGTMQLNGAGTMLEFTPSNSVGQVDFTYVASDSSARAVTGRVTVATVSPGIYANTDRFMVRGGGSDYELDVLSNDRSYPADGKELSIIGIGTGADAPSEGGSVSIVGNRLRYTPAAGFFGQESFRYVMSDTIDTDTALVTVTVNRGNLTANKDNFAVFYELDESGTNAQTFTLPVVLNDRIQPPLGQSIQITGLGVGSNAPSCAGSVSIGSDGVTLLYRPTMVPVGAYVERFTYEISDGTDRRSSAVVEVQVFNRIGELEPLTQDDEYTVARNSQNNTLLPLLNDFVLPGTADGWKITSVSATAYGGTVSISSTNVLYSPAVDFVGLDEFTYSVNDGLGGTGSATVRVHVGAQPTMPDLFVVLSGSAENELDVTANDALVVDYVSEYTLADAFGASQGGSVMLSSSNTVFYTPSDSWMGPYPYTETFFYTVSDDAIGEVTGTVQVVVHERGSDRSTTMVTVLVEGRNDIPVIQNLLPNPPMTDKETALPFSDITITEVDQQNLEPINVLVSLDNAAKGSLIELGDFVVLGGGRYALTNVTASTATTHIRSLRFVPAENRITVPTTETVRFTISVTDSKSAPVEDSQTAIAVTSINDQPSIVGTRSDQTVYAAVPIRLFSSVTIQEVDDLTLQPLEVTIRLNDPTHGSLRNLGSFSQVATGVYGATGITAIAATQQLRAMEFIYGAYLVQPNMPQLTVFQISIDDGFAAPVVDSMTSVLACNAYQNTVQPTNTILQKGLGFSVDTISDFSVAGAPLAAVNGTGSGSALVYRLQPGTTNTWTIWRQLQPVSVDASDKFGYAVAISDDMIAVGAIQDEVNSAVVGAVYLFQRDLGGSNNWGQLMRIAPTNLPASSQFGFSLDLDGDLLAVGAPKATLSGASPATGAVFLFGRNTGGTNAWGEVARWEPAGFSSLDFGWSVSLSGNNLAVGAPKNKSGLASGTPLGATYVLNRNTGGTNTWGLAQRIAETNLTTAVDFGYCVSMDDDVLAIGAPKVDLDGSQLGQVFMYQKASSSNVWQGVSRLDARDRLEAHFGYSLSVNKSYVFIGAPGNLLLYTNFFGSAYLYHRDSPQSSTWSVVEKFTRTTAAPNVFLQFGSAVSYKQGTAIVGATDSYFIPNSFLGQVYIYRLKFNNPPAVAEPVQDQLAEWNEFFEYSIPDGIFTDPDVDDTLTIHASMPAGGYGLDLNGMTVTGTPTTIGPIPIRVVATDENHATALDSFDVVVLVDQILLNPTPRNLWNVEHFGKTVANPAMEGTFWGGLANVDGDSSNNDQEYAFGGDPITGDASGIITLEATGDGNMVVSYVRRKDDPRMTYTVQGTATLTPPVWTDIQTLVLGEQTTPIDNAYERVNVTVSVPDAGPEMFFRVVVTP